MTSDHNARTLVDAHCDAAPRPTSDQEEIGPFTLFLANGAFPYYARPSRGVPAGFGPDEVKAVRARQVELGVPEQFEWIAELAPGLADALEASGMSVERRPLLILDTPRQLDPPDGVRLEFVEADLPLATWTEVVTAVDVGFANGGTLIGDTGVVERDAKLADAKPGRIAYFSELVRRGLMRWAAAVNESGPIGGGSYHPREVNVDGATRTVAEVTGISTLPSMRRRGIGAALVSALVADARARDVREIFMSATDDAVARVYERVGFRRIGTSCEAALPPTNPA